MDTFCEQSNKKGGKLKFKDENSEINLVFFRSINKNHDHNNSH